MLMRILFIIMIFSIVLSNEHAYAQSITASVSPQSDSKTKIYKRNKIQDEGKALVKKGLLEEAILKYREALNPDVINSENEKSTAIARIVDILVIQGKYKEALEQYRWFIDNRPTHWRTIDKKLELEAYVASVERNSSEPIKQYIHYLKEKYRKDLPPQKYDYTFSCVVTSPIIRMYDDIGDIDGGIAFVRGILAYEKLPARSREQYEKVLQAYEQDKREGSHGRASAYLVQSGYFLW